MISKRVSDLERRLGVRLLYRTTRNVEPTEAGLLLQVGQGLAAGPEQRRGKRGPARERPVRGIAHRHPDELRHPLAVADHRRLHE
ncbi:LysR family transcriptional regulator, partial [Salmonella sp. SAL04277]|uniref:helix-turn-helix domain-containing protein n=1 Tax=Salmonella sp. SAL04277 TaxID=3159855 RepID=UPI00397B082F